MRERCIRFGEHNQLNGILCMPAKVDTSKPAVILLNSGIMHHIGSCRTTVMFARSLAEAGTLSLRFDHAGIGDSEPHQGSERFEEYAPQEVIAAMDYLQKRSKTEKFVLYGLCSGADMAYYASLLDTRVIGVIQVDGYTYRTPMFYFNHYLPRVFRWKVWHNILFNRLPRRLGQWMKKAPLKRSSLSEIPTEFSDAVEGSSAVVKKSTMAKAVGEENVEMPSYIREFPPRTDVEAGIKQLVERQVQFYFIFTGSEDHFNYQNQVKDMYGRVNFGNQLQVEYYEDCSHIIKEPHRQKDVCQGITQWVTQLSHP